MRPPYAPRTEDRGSSSAERLKLNDQARLRTGKEQKQAAAPGTVCEGKHNLHVPRQERKVARVLPVRLGHRA